MRFTLKILAVVLAVALLTRMVSAASFTAALDRDAITLGESTTLSLKFEGVQPQAEPNLPAIPGLRFQYVGPASSFSFVNGQTTSSITYNYLVVAQREGEFTIPGMRADVSGQQVASAPLKLRVTKAGAPSSTAVNSGTEVAFMKLVFPKQRVYAGECVVAQLDLYLRDDVQNFSNFQLTGSPTDGFSAGKLVDLQNQRRRVQLGNHTYTVIPLAIPLTAVKTGALTLGPFTASAVVDLPSENGRQDPVFRQFGFRSLFTEQKQVAMATEPAKVECLPLPEPGRPANFTGAVGVFTMTATAGPTNLTVGDPITVRIQISGSGALDALSLPTQAAWSHFKTYPPSAKVEPADPFGFQGSKTFEQIISPLSAEVQELPPLTFAFFNPEDGRYQTLSKDATPLVVRAAGATPMPTVATAKNTAPENQTPQDILPIKDKLGDLSTTGRPLIVRPSFLALQSVPLLAFIAALVWRQRTDSLANNPRRRRQLAVAQLIRSGLNDLKQHAAKNAPDEFFALLFRLLQEQLGERLDCPASAITENVVEEHPILRNAPAATRDALRELFQLCNQARYAPVRGSGELNSVATKFEQTVSELQEVKA